jgi:hypothetical protein
MIRIIVHVMTSGRKATSVGDDELSPCSIRVLPESLAKDWTVVICRYRGCTKEASFRQYPNPAVAELDARHRVIVRISDELDDGGPAGRWRNLEAHAVACERVGVVLRMHLHLARDRPPMGPALGVCSPRRYTPPRGPSP